LLIATHAVAHHVLSDGLLWP